MTTAPGAHTEPTRPTPARFSAALQWGRRAGWPLRLVASGPGAPAAAEMEEVASNLTAGDPVADALAAALAAGRVSMREFRTHLDSCGEALLAGQQPPLADVTTRELRDFLETICTTPRWYDQRLAARGARACVRGGQTSLDILGDLSLLAGYRPSATTDLLMATGRLTGEGVSRRIAETMSWWYQVVRPGGCRPGSTGWRATAFVRLMHARVNRSYVERGWDVGTHGLPINQSDMAGTNNLFGAVFITGCRAMGVPYSRRESRAILHLWRYFGWLMGVDERWLGEDLRGLIRDQFHFILTAPPPNENSKHLARDLLAVHQGHDHPRPTRLRRILERERHLSIASAVNGPMGMRELGLRWMPPWYPALVIPVNAVSHTASRLHPPLRRRQERRGEQRIREHIVLYSHRTIDPDDGM